MIRAVGLAEEKSPLGFGECGAVKDPLQKHL